MIVIANTTPLNYLVLIEREGSEAGNAAGRACLDCPPA